MVKLINGYILKKGKRKKDAQNSIFLIKSCIKNGNAYGYVYVNKTMFFTLPSEYIGKRVRIKIEDVDEV